MTMMIIIIIVVIRVVVLSVCFSVVRKWGKRDTGCGTRREKGGGR